MKKIFTEKYRIYYEDTDVGGVVYYANYLKFFERARTDFLREMNIVQSELARDEKVVFVVRKCEIDYILPAKFDDLIEVSVVLERLGNASLIMFQEAKLGDVLLSTLRVKIAAVAADNFAITKIPPHVFSKLRLYSLSF